MTLNLLILLLDYEYDLEHQQQATLELESDKPIVTRIAIRDITSRVSCTSPSLRVSIPSESKT